MSPQILYLATNLYSKGGIQRYSRAQIRALREFMGESNVFVLSLYPPEQGQFEEPFEVNYYGIGGSFLGRIDFFLKAAQTGLRLNPKIVWANHVKLLPLANLIRWVSRKRSVVIGNVYGLEVWTDLRNYEATALKRADNIVSDSFFTASYINETIGVDKGNISVVWDPVDTDRFTPRETAQFTLPNYGIPYSQKKCYLMTLGRISERSRHKGYDRIIDVMKLMAREDINYIIVGDGDDRFRLEERVKDERLTGRVFFLGSVDESDLVDVYNSCDIFILVSDRGYGRGEGVPLTPLEAAACGKPIIVGDEDGSREAVEDGENGFIVSPRKLESIAQAITKMVDDPILREKMGRSARHRVERDFSYKVFKYRMSELIKNIH